MRTDMGPCALMIEGMTHTRNDHEGNQLSQLLMPSPSVDLVGLVAADGHENFMRGVFGQLRQAPDQVKGRSVKSQVDLETGNVHPGQMAKAVLRHPQTIPGGSQAFAEGMTVAGHHEHPIQAIFEKHRCGGRVPARRRVERTSVNGQTRARSFHGQPSTTSTPALPS